MSPILEQLSDADLGALVRQVAAAVEDPEALLDEHRAAALLDLSVATLRRMRVAGGGPRFVRISSRCVKYRRAALAEWARAHEVASTSEASA